MKGGYQGKILRVDLDQSRLEEQPLDPGLSRDYIGGVGFGARFLYDETGPTTDPMGPENILVLATGPMGATPAPTSGRLAVVTLSPLTHTYGEADIGGTFALGLKGAGYDAVVIRGQADRPVYLEITEEGARLRDATHLWGKDLFAADEILMAETNPGAKVLTIGPAGEKLSRISAIFTDGRNARAAGRGGLGAVMGAKRLKAVVAYGKKKTPVAHPEELGPFVKKILPGILEKTKVFQEYGTAGGFMGAYESGDLPIRNWSWGTWEEAPNLAGPRMKEKIFVKRFHCAACPVGCGREIEIKEGPYAGLKGAGPEYESLAGLGANCLVGDLEGISFANELSNKYGLDVISASSVIAFAMEAYEKGLLSEGDLAGVKPLWGRVDSLVELIHQIGRREGFGAILADGVRHAAELIGGGSSAFAIHVKGLEPPFHDPRAYASSALAYATMPNGAVHSAATYLLEGKATLPELGYPEILDRFAASGKGIMVAKMQDYVGLFNAMKMCRFLLRLPMSDILQLFNLVTGHDFNKEDLLKTGERLMNLKRLINLRRGFTRADDTLPPRLLHEPRGSGGSPDFLPKLEPMLDEYYVHRGWDRNGVPAQAKLKELGLP